MKLETTGSVHRRASKVTSVEVINMEYDFRRNETVRRMRTEIKGGVQKKGSKLTSVKGSSK